MQTRRPLFRFNPYGSDGRPSLLILSPPIVKQLCHFWNCLCCLTSECSPRLDVDRSYLEVDVLDESGSRDEVEGNSSVRIIKKKNCMCWYLACTFRANLASGECLYSLDATMYFVRGYDGTLRNTKIYGRALCN